ncbi:MAG: HEAT repeat domain-containing protein, partial [Planctomycetota bacterium]
AGRREALAAALTDRGTSVATWPTAGRGLASLRSLPGLDAIVVAADLPDLTTDQVIDELRRAQRFSELPVIVIGDDQERTEERFGERAAAILTSASDVSAVQEAMSESLNRDRERANRLAGEAGDAIAALAKTGRTDCGSTADGLAGTLAIRPEAVAVSSLIALGYVGSDAHVPDVLAILTDGTKSELLRVAAAQALGGIFGRVGQAPPETIESIVALATDEGEYSIRHAAAKALGSLDLEANVRAELMRSLRAGA